MTNRQEKIKQFLNESAQFRLGDLPTEKSNPLSSNLSALVETDLAAAIHVFQKIELAALSELNHHLEEIDELKAAVRECFAGGGRVFLCGCGATGRLSISLETNWRTSANTNKDAVVGFIAGGDYALVKSIENFEDHPEYGERQLLELGFGKNDLLISCTEGGETPFVIGATLCATKISRFKSFFLFCNPKDSLYEIERSKQIFDHPKIRSFSLPTGPQVICGSTRLQASSILYFACGLALFDSNIDDYLSFLAKADLTQLKNLIDLESKTYVTKSFLTYHVDDDAMPILTDLTERSPTFNLLPIENLLEHSTEAATVSLSIRTAQNTIEAWQNILKRQARPLDWEELAKKYNLEVMLAFDFSKGEKRKQLIGDRPHTHVRVKIENGEICFLSEEQKITSLALPANELHKNLFLKLIFNLVSTLAQCRNQRVLGNIMLFVKPSNKKLIDRAARFTRSILKDQYSMNSTYEEVVACVFEASETLAAEESVVLKSADLYRHRFGQ